MSDLKFNANKDSVIKKMYKAVIFITFVLVISAVVFTHYILKIEYETAKANLQQTVLQTASNIRGRVKNDINNLKNLSVLMLVETNLSSENDILNFIKNNVVKNNYYKLGFAYPSGKAFQYDQNGNLSNDNWYSESCFANAMTGNPCFAKTNEDAQASSGYTNRYFVPVFNKNNEIEGVLSAEIDSDGFKQILTLNNYNGKGYTHVIDSDGNYIIKSQNESNVYSNFFDSKIKFIGTTKEKVQEALKAQNEGSFLFRWEDGKTYIGAFGFIGNNNSFVLTDVPQDILMLHINTLLGGITVIVLTIAVMILALLRFTNKMYQQNEAAIYKVALTDEITESGNKTKFLLDAKNILDKSSDNDNFALISIDITKFKVINELFGYHCANKILKDVYEIIKRNLSKESNCARDFAATYVVLYKYDKEEFIIKYFINKVISEFERYNNEVIPSLKEENDVKVISKLTPAFGIYLIEDKNADIVQMCDRASLAKRNIKNTAMQNYQFYDDGLRAKILQDKAIEDEMYSALENNQFKMFLQPKFDMNTMKIVGAEALVRWFHPTRGIIPPMDFIPVFENNGFVIEIDKYIWEQACIFLSERINSDEFVFPISVNVSRLHLNNEAFIDELLQLTEKYNINHKYLELELTETACLENTDNFAAIANKLTSLGFTISMDDFGTGYSSLNMLRHLPVNVLKLDRGFITDSIMEEKGKIVIRSILSMANKLNIDTVAEGIETPEQAEFLRQAGCKTAQGFLYGRPMEEKTFVKTFLTVNQ